MDGPTSLKNVLKCV